MASLTGDKLKISIFGESHSEAIGVLIDGFPAGGTKVNKTLFITFTDNADPILVNIRHI